MSGASTAKGRTGRGESSLPLRYLTPMDLAALLDVPIGTIYQWRSRGGGPPGFRIGCHLRYDPRAVEEWIAGLVERGA